jgi:hypothetical protein
MKPSGGGGEYEELIYRVKDGGQDSMDAITTITSKSAESMGLGNTIATDVSNLGVTGEHWISPSWAINYNAGVNYSESAYIPGAHQLATRRQTKLQGSAHRRRSIGVESRPCSRRRRRGINSDPALACSSSPDRPLAQDPTRARARAVRWPCSGCPRTPR